MSARLIGSPTGHSDWHQAFVAQPVVGTPAEFYRNFGQPIYP
ncbi:MULTISPECIES: hypothetical protein [Micrococcaceae]|nr:hypothetical protein [Arthrobacter sp. NIO-1057]SCC31052.1 hypothetical protein GA0061084_2097 [Arthrobacter sp. NIO-1057]